MRTLLLSLFAGLVSISAQAANTALNDAQIAAIVVTANQVDVDAGKLAEKHGQSKEVKDFGKEMVSDHNNVNKEAKDLAKKLKLKPEDNDTSKSLKDGGKENIAKLKKLKGMEFDKAYIEHEVAYHQQVIDAVTNTLIPNAKNPELKALLEKAGPLFNAHLTHAKSIQQSMK